MCSKLAPISHQRNRLRAALTEQRSGSNFAGASQPVLRPTLSGSVLRRVHCPAQRRRIRPQLASPPHTRSHLRAVCGRVHGPRLAEHCGHAVPERVACAMQRRRHRVQSFRRRSVSISALAHPIRVSFDCENAGVDALFPGFAAGNFSAMTSPGQQPPTCVRHCGLPAEPCGYESCNSSLQLDVHAKPPMFNRYPSTYSQPVECRDGYRARPRGANQSACSNPLSYQRTCGFCLFLPALHECVPVQCDWDPGLDPNGRVGESQVLFPSRTTVTCNTGFRPASGGINPTKEAERAYELACAATCQLRPVVPGELCRPVTCGDGILVPNAEAFGSAEDEAVHGNNPIWVKCKAGYRLEASKTTVDAPCVNEFMVRCEDGVLEFSVDEGVSFVNSPQPSCVRHCGRLTDECGSEAVCRFFCRFQCSAAAVVRKRPDMSGTMAV